VKKAKKRKNGLCHKIKFFFIFWALCTRFSKCVLVSEHFQKKILKSAANFWDIFKIFVFVFWVFLYFWCLECQKYKNTYETKNASKITNENPVYFPQFLQPKSTHTVFFQLFVKYYLTHWKMWHFQEHADSKFPKFLGQFLLFLAFFYFFFLQKKKEQKKKRIEKKRKSICCCCHRKFKW